NLRFSGGKRYGGRWWCFLMAATAATLIQAETGRAADQLLLQQEPALCDQDLDRLRGGFLGRDGLLINFSFQRVLQVNGELQAQTVLRVPGLDLPTVPDGKSGVGIVQTGRDNSLSSNAFANSTGQTALVVQNSLDNQVIQYSKILNVEISGYRLSDFASFGLHSRLGSSLIQALH
ncbi:MAG: hypothetical protein M0017_10925, partial [Desulfobacteraceae bacterium]|nr:hypothetical protein [Desulfobacteraceae bacterium]